MSYSSSYDIAFSSDLESAQSTASSASGKASCWGWFCGRQVNRSDSKGDSAIEVIPQPTQAARSLKKKRVQALTSGETTGHAAKIEALLGKKEGETVRYVLPGEFSAYDWNTHFPSDVYEPRHLRTLANSVVKSLESKGVTARVITQVIKSEVLVEECDGLGIYTQYEHTCALVIEASKADVII